MVLETVKKIEGLLTEVAALLGSPKSTLGS